MQCLTETSPSVFQVASPQPTELNGCTYLIVQPNELSPAITSLTPEQGALIGGAIIACWAVGFGIRSAIHALQTKESENQDEI